MLSTDWHYIPMSVGYSSLSSAAIRPSNEHHFPSISGCSCGSREQSLQAVHGSSWPRRVSGWLNWCWSHGALACISKSCLIYGELLVNKWLMKANRWSMLASEWKCQLGYFNRKLIFRPRCGQVYDSAQKTYGLKKSWWPRKYKWGSCASGHHMLSNQYWLWLQMPFLCTLKIIFISTHIHISMSTCWSYARHADDWNWWFGQT